MPTLVVTSGPLAGERIELTGELIIGREHADLTIDDPEMSRRHAAIRVSDGGIELEDLGSTNGTLVDGVRISAPVMLGGGERVKLGETAIEIEVEIEVVDDDATRLHQSPHDADLTMMRTAPTAPPPDATAAYAAPLPDATAAYAPPPPPPGPLPSAPPPPAPALVPAQPAQPALPVQPFGAFTPTAGGRAGGRQGVATRLWVPAVLTFATIGGTAVALILYFAGR